MNDNTQNYFTKLFLMIMVAVLTVGAGLLWLLNSETFFGPALVLVIIVALAFGAIWYRTEGFRSIGKDLPMEDERSKKVMQKTAANSFYFSLYWLLLLMWLVDDVVFVGWETRQWLELGILGMAVIFGLNWVYVSRFGKLD